VVRAHWRAEPGNATLLKRDLQPVIDDQLQQHARGLIAQHARAVAAGAVQRADAIKAELQRYAQALAG
jgi:hypothetical protein